MPKIPRIDAAEAETMLLNAGFVFVRSRGSHRIYMKAGNRFVLPFHAGRILHPKIVKDLLAAVSK